MAAQVEAGARASGSAAEQERLGAALVAALELALVAPHRLLGELDTAAGRHAEAAATIRALDDAQLDRVAPTAVHWGAPLSVQYVIEQHPIAHPYIHLESIRAALDARPRR